MPILVRLALKEASDLEIRFGRFIHAKIKQIRHGVGSMISVYKKILHPRAPVAAKYKNSVKTDILHGLLAEGKRRKRFLKITVLYGHESQDFDNGQLLHSQLL